jgi:hypothetical protein
LDSAGTLNSLRDIVQAGSLVARDNLIRGRIDRIDETSAGGDC